MRPASLLFLVISILLFHSCKEKTINNVNEDNVITTRNHLIKLPNEVFNNIIDLNTLIKEYDYIPLETKNECMIGSIHKVLILKDSYIIHDRDNNKIYRFNKEGKFMNQVGNKGNGPKEYNEAWDVSIGANNDISVLDLKGRKLMSYGLDGSYLNEWKMNFLFTQHEYLDNKLVCNIYKSENAMAPSLNGYKLVVTDSLNDVSSKAIKYEINPNNHFTTWNPLRNFCGKIFFNDPYHNRIIGINDQGVFQEFTIDYEDNIWDKKVNFDMMDDKAIEQAQKESIYMIGDYVVSDSILYFKVINKSKGADIFYSLKNDSFIGGSSYKNEKSRIKMKAFKTPQWLGAEGTFVSSINAFHLVQNKDYILEEGLNNLSEKERQMISKIKETDNPILVFYKLNEF